LIAQSEAIFLKLIIIGKDCYTGQYIADGLNETIKDISPKNIVAIITDNTSNIKKSWKGVQIEYLEILCFGCGFYITNFLIKDIIKVLKLYQHFEAVKNVN